MKHALILIGLLLIAACAPQGRAPASAGSIPANAGNVPIAAANTQTSSTAPDKIFKLTGEMFKFRLNGAEAPELRVKQGDTVRIEFTSTDGFHDWVVDEFNARTERVNTGGSTQVTFVADKKGTFEYYCSVGQHRANGMRGNLIVE
jgi:nitrite reductase (NO-forming)